MKEAPFRSLSHPHPTARARCGVSSATRQQGRALTNRVDYRKLSRQLGWVGCWQLAGAAFANVGGGLAAHQTFLAQPRDTSTQLSVGHRLTRDDERDVRSELSL